MLNSLDDIKHAINRLPARDRYRITAWLFDSQGESESANSRAAEPPPPAYNAAPQRRRMSVEEYLEFEKTSPVRHEYIGGQIFAMTGASTKHNLIIRNLSYAFTGHMRGGPCIAFTMEVKVGLNNNSDDIYYYPDVVVTCDRKNVEEYIVRNPKLIIEVLSPSTESTDRREKFSHYRLIKSLEEYILITQDRFEVTFFRRSGNWDPEEALTAPEAVAEFRSIGLSMPVGRIYEGVEGLKTES